MGRGDLEPLGTQDQADALGRGRIVFDQQNPHEPASLEDRSVAILILINDSHNNS
jgi:hypothetical protein